MDMHSKIDGTWVPTTALMAGQPFPPPVLQAMQLVVTGGEYVVTVGPTIDKGTVTIDATTTPLSMAVTGVEGPNAGKTFPAIFLLEHDTLRICYDLSGQARPTAFVSPAGTMHFLVEYQRA